MAKELIKVLIVDDIEETRENLRKALAFEDRIDIVGEATDGYQAIDMACKYKPNIILMDINMPEMDGIQATERIALKCPASSVIMVSVQGEKEYLKRAMLAGAKEFLIKPFSPDEVNQTIINVYELDKQRNSQVYAHQMVDNGFVESSKVITLFSGKGGVGKSLIAVNLAVALARNQKKVAIVDLDLMFGDVASLFNIRPKETIYHVVQEIDRLDGESIRPFLMEATEGVSVLSAPVRPEHSEIITGKHVEKILRLLKEGFDYVIVDTPAFLTDPVLALDSSDFIFLVNTLNVPVLRHNKTVLELMESLNFPVQNIRMLLNRSDLDTGIMSKDVKIALGMEPYRILPEDSSVELSINRGEPLVQLKQNSKWSKQIEKLAQQIIAENERATGRQFLKPFITRRKKA